MSAFFFIWFFTAGLWTVNALRRPVPPHQGFPPLWLPGMIVSEMAPLLFVERALVALVFIALGALDRTIGLVGLLLFLLGEVGLVFPMLRSLNSARATGHSPRPATLFQVVESLPAGTIKRTEVAYWGEFSLDLYTPAGRVSDAPGLVYVHPGSWMRGRPGRQARPMIHRLVEMGWLVFDIRYPLSPAATFPDHLVGVKRAIAWVRANASELGLDAQRIAISGGSSGAHLAALAALTSANSSLQPGFEAADTSVIACVPFYGIFDLLVRNPTRYDWPFVARHVLKARAEDRPELYALASPVDQIHPGAPPFLVVHGEFDSIVLPAESRLFAAALDRAGVEVRYEEIAGAQHGFDAIAALRARAVGAMCAEWLRQHAGVPADPA